jgi:CrcB protein
MKYALIAAFGLAGVFARYAVGILASRLLPAPLPFGTFFINVTGAFLIGVTYVLGVEHELIPTDARIAVMTGFLGGYTTFSSYCLESARLFEEGDLRSGLLYFGVSPLIGGLATFSGLIVTRWLLQGDGT